MLRLFLIESLPAVCRGLRLLLSTEPGLRVVGEARGYAAALRALPVARPDIVIVDIDGLEIAVARTAQTLECIARSASVILLTLRDNEQVEVLARQVGAAAVVVKSSPPDALLRAVREVARKRVAD